MPEEKSGWVLGKDGSITPFTVTAAGRIAGFDRTKHVNFSYDKKELEDLKAMREGRK